MTETAFLSLFQKWRQTPLARGALHGAIFVCLSAVLDAVDYGALRDDWGQWALLIFAAALIFTEVVDGATIARKGAVPWSANGLHYAYATGFGFAVPFMLALWTSEHGDIRNVLVCFGVAAVFGLWSNHSFDPDRPALVRAGLRAEDLTQFYSKDLNDRHEAWNAVLFHAWPLAAIGLIILLALAPPETGWGGLYIESQLVFLLGLMSRWTPKNWLLSARIWGFAAFLAAILVW